MEKAKAGIQFDILAITAANGVDLTNGAIPVTSGSVFYTGSFSIEDGTYAFLYKAASEGNVSVKLELEQGFADPTTEGSADNSWVVPDSAAEFDDDLDDELYHIKAYPPAAAPLARFKITGLEGVDASTQITVLKGSVIK
jgi:hypothetical protein